MTSACGTKNTFPSFHASHGPSVRIFRGGSWFRVLDDYRQAVAFSASQIQVNEKVCIRLAEIRTWSGSVSLGFTNNDPAAIATSHPDPDRASNTDLMSNLDSTRTNSMNKPGHWMKRLEDRFCQKDNKLSYYVNSKGEVYLEVNGKEEGLFLSGVDTSQPLWASIEINGNNISVIFLATSKVNDKK